MDVETTPESKRLASDTLPGSSSVATAIAVAMVAVLVVLGVILIIVYASGPASSDTSRSVLLAAASSAPAPRPPRPRPRPPFPPSPIYPVPPRVKPDVCQFLTLQPQQLLDGFVEMRQVYDEQRPALDALSIQRQDRICFTCALPNGDPGIQTDPTYQPIYWQYVQNRPDQHIIVIRDDLLCGGMKTRVLQQTLERDYDLDVREYVYVSRPFGYEQVTLAYTILRMNNGYTGADRKRAVLFVRRGDNQEANLDSALAQKLGATVIFVSRNEDPNQAAQRYVNRGGGQTNIKRVLLPEGFKSNTLIEEIGYVAQRIASYFGKFDEAFCSVGSGALLLGLQKGDLAQRYYGVCVYGPQQCPSALGDAQTLSPTVPFDDPVPPDQAPPFSSSLHYDSKVWIHVRNRPGKLVFYNVL